jgi:hypothetical protein
VVRILHKINNVVKDFSRFIQVPKFVLENSSALQQF